MDLHQLRVFQAAINAANTGDTVLVAPGIYNENIDFKGKAVTVTSGAKAFTDSSVASTVINGSVDGPVVNIATNEPVAATLNASPYRTAMPVSAPDWPLAASSFQMPRLRSRTTSSQTI